MQLDAFSRRRAGRKRCLRSVAPERVEIFAVAPVGRGSSLDPAALAGRYGSDRRFATIPSSADEREHKFPTPHTDYISQFIDYPVPIELFSEIARFDGSVVPNRTTGEVFASCDMEAMNFLSLNLMHDIVSGRTSVDEARKRYTEEASAYAMNRPAPYTEKLQFEPPQGETADPDEAMMAGSMMNQAVEKAKDVLGGDKD